MVTKNIGAAEGDDSDPPIIVTGGGGSTPTLKPARNTVTIDYHPDGSKSRKKLKARTNASPNIKGVTIQVVTNPPSITQPITLAGAQQYDVHVTFLTDPPPPRPAPGKRGKQKKKYATKSPTAGKRKTGSKSK